MRAYAWIVLVGCGGGQHPQTREASDFDCKDRMASYTTAHHMSGDEIGVQIDCAKGPHITRWKTDKNGKRIEDGHAISGGEFEELWTQIEGTGWRNLFDCANGSGKKTDPVYQFDIKDDTDHKQFTCQSAQMPYPYNNFVDPLDLAAQQGGKQLGDDEPDDAKALDKKPHK